MSTLLVGVPQGGEWILILVVVVLLFGARKLPELARSLGASAKEFRRGIDEGSKEDSAEASVTEDLNEKGSSSET